MRPICSIVLHNKDIRPMPTYCLVRLRAPSDLSPHGVMRAIQSTVKCDYEAHLTYCQTGL
jgi:hypothetical protein